MVEVQEALGCANGSLCSPRTQWGGWHIPTGINPIHRQDRGVTLPARHAGPCPLPLCLPLDSEEYQIHPLSFCDKTTFIFFFSFFKEKEIPDLSGPQQIT